jgi:hypothetical protein
MLHEDGSLQWVDLEDIGEYLRTSLPKEVKITKIQVRFDLQELQPGFGEQYLNGFGVDFPENSQLGHTVFYSELAHRKYPCLIPAATFIKFMTSFYPSVAAKFFYPNFLEQMVATTVDGNNLIFELRDPGHRKNYADKFLRIMSLLLCYPSFQKFLFSIHASAMGGLLDFELPKAKFTGFFFGVVVNEIFYVTSIATGNFVPTEEHFPWTDPHTFGEEKPVFFGRVQSDENYLYLTDSEWEAIRLLVSSGKDGRQRPIDNYRNAIDMILLKKFTNCPWKDLKPDEGTYINVLGIYKRLKKSKALAEIESILEELRMRC